MQAAVITVQPRATVQEAIALARARGVRHLPVVAAASRRAGLGDLAALRAPGGTREAVIRAATIDPRRAVAAIESRGYAVRDARRPT